ncbi:hypothetical protein PM082_017553 [Marasmius tenuissimus]|nr:hypothetical protein PM082_017553 [Marasmius tenuissimus]
MSGTHPPHLQVAYKHLEDMGNHVVSRKDHRSLMGSNLFWVLSSTFAEEFVAWVVGGSHKSRKSARLSRTSLEVLTPQAQVGSVKAVDTTF